MKTPFSVRARAPPIRFPPASTVTVRPHHHSFFSKPKVQFNWLNDFDYELIATFKIMRDPTLRRKLVELVNQFFSDL